LAAFAKLAHVSLSCQKRYELGERIPDIKYADALKNKGGDTTYGEFHHNFSVNQMTASAVAKILCISKRELENALEKSLSVGASKTTISLYFSMRW